MRANIKLLVTKLVVVLLVQALIGCAVAPEPELPDVASNDKLTDFAVSKATYATMNSTPIRDYVWMLRVGEARVPVLDSGTPHADVLATVRQWGLDPLVGEQAIIIREGPSRSGWATSEPRFVVYGFRDGRLNVGPLNLGEMVEVYVFWGLDADDFYLVNSLAAVEPFTPGALNNLAWAFATVSGASKRSPHLAIRFAEKANALTNNGDSDYLDTLAAAYAAAGQFDRAVEYQRKAIDLAEGDATDMRARLALYELAVPYVAPPQKVSEVGVAFPRKSVFERAEEDDSEAQWELAVFFLENEITEYETLQNPGAHYLLMAAANDNMMAIQEIGFGYLHGTNQFPADIDRALEWLNRAAAAGSDLAAYNLAMIYRDGIGGIARDETLVTSWLGVAAERGVAEAAVEVAYRYLEGLGAVRDVTLARRFFDIGAENDVSPEDSMMGDHHFDYEIVGIVESEDDLPVLPLAMEDYPRYWYALAEDVKAQLKRGDPYLTARLSDTHYFWLAADGEALVFSLTHAAANYGSKLAQQALAGFYEKGAGTQASASKARYWHARARHNQSGL